MIWTTRDGRQVTLDQMSDRHLFNTIKWIEKIFKDAAYRKALALEGISGSIHGEMASLYHDQQISALLAVGHPSEVCSVYYPMIKEGKRRGLLAPEYDYGFFDKYKEEVSKP